MSGVTGIGLLAGTMTTLAYFPQVVKSWRTRSTSDVSLAMFLIMVCGTVLWLIYGALIRDIPIICANGATLLLAGTILIFKLRNG